MMFKHSSIFLFNSLVANASGISFPRVVPV